MAKRNEPNDRVSLPVSSGQPASPKSGDFGYQAGRPKSGDFGYEAWRGEFPAGADLPPDAASRREFLKLMGASLALAGVAGCGDVEVPPEKIVPHVQGATHEIAGRPLFFATGLTLGGYAAGVLAESRDGRPIKIEGNPSHPASLGGTDAFAQASLLSLYDPDRAQAVLEHGQISSWERFVAELRQKVGASASEDSASPVRLHLLTETVTSPSLAALIGEVLERYPAATWRQYEPVARYRVYEATKQAFGEMLEPRYRFDRAEIVVSLDADFLTAGPGAVRYAHDYASRRRVQGESTAESFAERVAQCRLYTIESCPTPTGAMADHRLALSPQRLAAFAKALARRIVSAEDPIGEPDALASGRAAPTATQDWSERESMFLEAIASDLAAHRGASVIVPGDHLPPEVQAAAHLINEALGGVGTVVEYSQPVAAAPTDPIASLRELAGALDRDEVDVLLILGGNPVYSAPPDLQFAERLEHAPFAVHLSLYDDETSASCDWLIPAAHELESWGDARAYDGTVTLQQPLIHPLYDGKTPHELLAALLDPQPDPPLDIVRAFWQRRYEAEADTGRDFDSFWQSALHDGFLRDSALPAEPVTPQQPLSELLDSSAGGTAAERDGKNGGAVTVRLLPDPCIWDGRFANNAWLQELPKPLTKLTWDNAVLVSPRDARQWTLDTGQMVRLEHAGRELTAPVFVLPGHAENCVTLHLGYGRRRAGRVGTGVGFNAYTLRSREEPWTLLGATLTPTGDRYPLATTQHHYRMEGRAQIRHSTLAHFRADPDFADHADGHHGGDHLPTLYDGPPRQGEYAWGMAVDLNVCTGCSACVLACQAENNIPVVGKQEVLRGREMHWLRIDSYREGPEDDPRHLHQPVMCMHCENAPCEVVCPVAATTHSIEGLNEMTYNRCVGTRYCSNNCPYKVRRFNFFDYSGRMQPDEAGAPILDLLYNPEVSVRSRGVMEKCTYCVQRIQAGKIEAKKENRPIGDGEIVTACQSVCPVQAITFGDVSDDTTRVAKLKEHPLNYVLLKHTNTRPRTSYLARLTNPNESAGPR